MYAMENEDSLRNENDVVVFARSRHSDTLVCKRVLECSANLWEYWGSLSTN